MEDYTWTTEQPMNTNADSMNDFIDNHLYEYCGKDYEVVYEDGSYVEIQDNNDLLYEVRVTGNGDFCNHIATFKTLN